MTGCAAEPLKNGRLREWGGRFPLMVLILALLLPGSAGHAAPPVSALENGRKELVMALKRQKILHPARKLTHLSYVCSLQFPSGSKAVIDLREVVPGAAVPRGVNRILILHPSGKVASEIDYAVERPLDCRGSKLIVGGDLAVDNLEPSGNVLTFDPQGRFVRAEQVDAQKLWPPDRPE